MNDDLRILGFDLLRDPLGCVVVSPPISHNRNGGLIVNRVEEIAKVQMLDKRSFAVQARPKAVDDTFDPSRIGCAELFQGRERKTGGAGRERLGRGLAAFPSPNVHGRLRKGSHLVAGSEPRWIRLLLRGVC